MESDTAKYHLSEIASIMLHTRRAHVDAYLMGELAKSKISLVVTDEKHNPIGQYLPLYGAHNVSKRVNEQLAWGEPIKKRVWQRVVREKITQQASLLEDCDLPQSLVLRPFVSEVKSGDTTNREAAAARVHFQALFGMDFIRERECAENAALDYGYAILLSAVNREIVSRGYLTQCGICHRNEYNQFNLACDFMEPFRPLVDRLVVERVGCDFDAESRKVLADVLNRFVRYREGDYRVGSVISLFVQGCLNALNKKISVDDIEGFEVL